MTALGLAVHGFKVDCDSPEPAPTGGGGRVNSLERARRKHERRLRPIEGGDAS